MKRRNGFTLLEMIVVLAVFALLMVAVTEGMRFAGLASQIGEKTLDWANQIEPADRALRAIIEQIRPSGMPETDAALTGEPRSMSFTSELADPSVGLEQAQATINLSFSNHQLVVRSTRRPHAQWIGPPSPVRETVLADRLEGVGFAYWTGSRWTDRWDQTRLPRLIRIRLQFPEGDVRHWPDIVASPMRDTLP